MPVPQVAIVGRPNVGKSSIFNWLAGHRLAIVDDMPGVTRDRVSYLMSDRDRYFDLVDTGGIGIHDEDNLARQVEDQITAGIENAAVVLFVLDAQAGLTALDEEISKRLRYLDKPILCVANKADSEKLEAHANEFYRLGRGKVIAVSVRANRNRAVLLNNVLERLPKAADDEGPEEPLMKVAIVGRRNVGKSTFVNTLVKAERMIVSEVPGTTRDSVDVRFELDGKVFMAIDTPGVRKGKSVRTDLEFYSTHRAKRSIRRADVVLMFFDASERLSRVDKQLCKYIADEYKPCVFVVNKWDLIHNHMPTERWVRYLHDNFKTMWHVPIAFVTGKTGKNVKALLNHAQMLHKQNQQRVSTSDLNRLIRSAVERQPPPMEHGRRPKIYFATQVSVEPPSIVMMCNRPSAFPATYRQYLLNVFRDQLPFGEVPIKLYLQKRERGDKRDEVKMMHASASSEEDEVAESSSPS